MQEAYYTARKVNAKCRQQSAQLHRKWSHKAVTRESEQNKSDCRPYVFNVVQTSNTKRNTCHSGSTRIASLHTMQHKTTVYTLQTTKSKV